jgi:hypothetical protein
MILRRDRIGYFILSFSIISSLFINPGYCQKGNPAGINLPGRPITLKQDTIPVMKKRNLMAEEPDTNFTWEKYSDFLHKVSDTSKYIVVPLNEFRQTFSSKKIIIGLRHDVDIDLNVAYSFSQIEYGLGIRSTYFILHTAPYYLANPNNMAIHTNKIIPVLKKMQDERHFEIGWHNDLVTLQVIYNINPVTFLHNELNWLRSNGLTIDGIAAHGSNYCKTYHYMNFYFFTEFTDPIVPGRENNVIVPKENKNITLIKGKMADFDLKYEAYFLNNNKAFSDATITGGIRWNIRMLDLNQLQGGDRVIILLHPIHWHKGSVHASFESFSLPEQKSCSIDSINSVINVEMPYGTNTSSLIAEFSVSPGAYVKVDGKMQESRRTANSFIKPLIYRVYAENRSIQREWTVNIHFIKNPANFDSFTLSCIVGQSIIDSIRNTVEFEIREGVKKDSLKPYFILSPGSRAWIGTQEQISGMNYRDFSFPVNYDIVSKDSQVIKKWKVSLFDGVLSRRNKKSEYSDLTIYPNPSEGHVYLRFANVKTSPMAFDIFNTMGEKVFTQTIKKTGDFTCETDLRKLHGGVYIVKYSEASKPGIIVIKSH